MGEVWFNLGRVRKGVRSKTSTKLLLLKESRSFLGGPSVRGAGGRLTSQK